jgi:hypothetical protein
MYAAMPATASPTWEPARAGSLRHNAQIRHEGKYALAVRYTCTSKDGKISVNVNGKTQVVNTPKTQSNEWLKAKVDVDLVKGAIRSFSPTSEVLPCTSTTSRTSHTTSTG